MAKMEYTIEEHVATVTMNSGENRFNYDFIAAFHEVLDAVEHQTEATVMVVKSADPKIWSNGIDLDWLIPRIEKEGPPAMDQFRVKLYGLMRRILMFPMLTVAAITGHAFAGGAFLSFAHDFRFMRSDRGWLCLPEVDLNIPLGPVFQALSRRALPTFLFEQMQFTGRRLTAAECEAHQVVLKACHIDQLMDEVMAFAKSLNKPREIVAAMKLETHAAMLKIIDESIAAAEKKS